MTVLIALLVAVFWTVVLVLYLGFFFGVGGTRPRATERAR